MAADPTTLATEAISDSTEALFNTSSTNATAMSFIFTPIAFAISGVFVLSALLLTCVQVSQYSSQLCLSMTVFCD